MSDQGDDELEAPRRDALGRWLPNQSGNPRGMPKGHRRLTNDLYRLLAEMPSAAELEDIYTQLEIPGEVRAMIDQAGDRQEMMARVLMWRAARGNWKAWEEVFNRLSPIAQSHEISGPGGGPITAVGLNIAGNVSAQTAQDRYLALVQGATDGAALPNGERDGTLLGPGGSAGRATTDPPGGTAEGD